MGRAPTRSAVLELQAERAVVDEAYDFLDEKRLLLASELMRQLEVYERLLHETGQRRQGVIVALARAVGRHGLQGLQVYPADNLGTAELALQAKNFMGVRLAQTTLRMPEIAEVTGDAFASPEGTACATAFRELLVLEAELAGVAGNLHRLLTEYRATERRARALENVILPEIAASLQVMETHLEELEFEDNMRVRMQRRS